MIRRSTAPHNCTIPRVDVVLQAVQIVDGQIEHTTHPPSFRHLHQPSATYTNLPPPRTTILITHSFSTMHQQLASEPSLSILCTRSSIATEPFLYVCDLDAPTPWAKTHPAHFRPLRTLPRTPHTTTVATHCSIETSLIRSTVAGCLCPFVLR